MIWVKRAKSNTKLLHLRFASKQSNIIFLAYKNIKIGTLKKLTFYKR